MIETGQQQQVMPVTIARIFYRHACKTLAMCLVAFGVTGALGVGALYADGTLDRAFVVVTFFAWGGFGAATVLALRKPPF